MGKGIRTLACLALLVLALGSRAAAIVVDDFEQPPTALPFYQHYLEQYIVGFGDIYTNPGSDKGLPLPNTIGGERDFQLSYMGGGAGSGADAAARVVGVPGLQYLEYSNSSKVETQFDIAYGSAATQLDANFSAETAILLDFLSTDQASQFIVQLSSELGTGSAMSQSVVYPLPDGFSGIFAVPLSDFAGINLADLDRIAFSFGYSPTWDPDQNPDEPTYAANFDMGVDFIGTQGAAIPEPATLALLGLGLAALARRRKR